jgi:nucleoside triphosphate pyrophosphatase
LILASASPRRAELLAAAGILFRPCPVDVDERPLDGEAPRDYVLRVARDKARACASAPDAVVLAADTAVVVAGEILGKPADADDAARMLRLLSGRVHLVLTGVALRRGDREVGAVEATAVTFDLLTEEEIAWYTSTAEPSDKAGAYAVQGLASRFIARVDGSYTNVVGLPVATVCRLLRLLEPVAGRDESGDDNPAR